MDDSFLKTGLDMLLFKAHLAGKWQRNVFSDMGMDLDSKSIEILGKACYGKAPDWLLEVMTLLQQPPDSFWRRSESLHQDFFQLFLACLAERGYNLNC